MLSHSTSFEAARRMGHLIVDPLKAAGAFQPDRSQELIYCRFFQRELERLGEADTYYPVGGAANYSLLYVVTRIVADHRPTRVLDIGGGQTSQLLSRLRVQGFAGSVLTLEADEAWAGRIRRHVDHEVMVSPLRPRLVRGVQVRTHDWDAVRARGPFDMILVDGPRGERRFSRYGVLELIDETLPRDFVIVLDDTERVGERDTVHAIHRRLIELKRDYAASTIRAAKTQAVFCAGAYADCAFL